MRSNEKPSPSSTCVTNVRGVTNTKECTLKITIQQGRLFQNKNNTLNESPERFYRTYKAEQEVCYSNSSL